MISKYPSLIVLGILMILSSTIPCFAAGPADDPLGSYIGYLQERQTRVYPDTPKMVLSFYYPWYRSEDYSGNPAHWEGIEADSIASSTHYPKLGPYDSNDPTIVKKHMGMMKEAGIDGIICSWWGIGGYEEEPVPTILDEAAKAGIKVCMYLEAENAESPEGRIADTAEDLKHIAGVFGKHPAYLKVGGAPVVFLYSRVMGQLSGFEWMEAVKRAEKSTGPILLIPDGVSTMNIAAFDGAHDYNPLSMVLAAGDKLRDTATSVFVPNVALEEGFGKVSTVTVIPGYDDTKIRKPGIAADRRSGGTYGELWEAAISADPDWVLITSFNEWHEGSEIEPSQEYGNKYMTLTKEYSTRFKSRKTGNIGSKSPISPLKPTPREKDMLQGLYEGRKVGLLPDLSPMGPAFLWLVESGLRVVSVSSKEAAKGIDPKDIPVLVYAGGENYTSSASTPGDVVKGLTAYTKAGGIIVAAPGMPWPMYYDGPGKSNTATGPLGIPVNGGWESPPKGKSYMFRPNSEAAPGLTAPFPFPTGGDLRWRPAKKAGGKDVYIPFVTLIDEDGKSQGDGAAFVKHSATSPVGGRAAYIWFRLLDQPESGRLLFEVFRYIGGEIGK